MVSPGANPSLLDVRTSEDLAEGVPLVDVQLLDFDQSMANFRVPLWAKDLPAAMRMTWDLHRSIKQRFDAEGIPLGRPGRVHYQGTELGQARGALRE